LAALVSRRLELDTWDQPELTLKSFTTGWVMQWDRVRTTRASWVRFPVEFNRRLENSVEFLKCLAFFMKCDSRPLYFLLSVTYLLLSKQIVLLAVKPHWAAR